MCQVPPFALSPARCGWQGDDDNAKSGTGVVEAVSRFKGSVVEKRVSSILHLVSRCDVCNSRGGRWVCGDSTLLDSNATGQAPRPWVNANSNGLPSSLSLSASHSVTAFANPCSNRPRATIVVAGHDAEVVSRKRRPGFAGSMTIECTGMSGMAVEPVPSIASQVTAPSLERHTCGPPNPARSRNNYRCGLKDQRRG